LIAQGIVVNIPRYFCVGHYLSLFSEPEPHRVMLRLQHYGAASALQHCIKTHYEFYIGILLYGPGA
jgi:hypothetical protein